MTDLDKLILILRRSTGISQELAEEVAVLYKDLFKTIDLTAPYQVNRLEISALLKDFDLHDKFTSKLLAVSSATVTAHTALEAITSTKKLVNDALNIIMPINPPVSTNDLIRRTKGVMKTSVNNLTLTAINDGWTQTQLRKALTVSEIAIKRNVAMIARTSVNAVSNHTKAVLYAKNDIVDRVLFSATLDGRTTDICMTLDGKVYKKARSPILPLHPNERSQLIPILKGESAEQVINDLLPRPAVEIKSVDALEDKGFKTRTGRIRKPSRSDRSPLKGVQSNSLNYESWIRKQPKAYQEEIIGIKGTKALREGVKLKDVIGTSPITEQYLQQALN